MTHNAPPKCPSKIIGTKLTIVHCEGAWKSFEDALLSMKAAKHPSVKASMDKLVKRLADGGRLSRETFPPEGLLPCLKGKKAKKFYAFKKIPIRAYGWYSERIPSVYFISHYVYKNWDKLSEADTAIVHGNWTRIEVQGDEK